MKMHENENVPLALTRSTFAHGKYVNGFTFHSAVAARSSFSENVPETAANTLLVASKLFDAYENKLLMHDSCMFSTFYELHQNLLSLKM